MLIDNKKMTYGIGAIFLIFLDRFFKALALVNWQFQSIKLWQDWLIFEFQKNYYIAFSLPLSGVWLNIAIVIIIVILLFYLIVNWRQLKNFETLSLFLIIGGAMSNLFDRLRYGYVIDYFSVKFFTIFNLADCLIVGGVAIILFFYLFLSKKKV